jgi:hypothetical protein
MIPSARQTASSSLQVFFSRGGSEVRARMWRGKSGEWYREHKHDVFEHFLFHMLGSSVGQCQADQFKNLEGVKKCLPGARPRSPRWTAATFAAQDLASREEMRLETCLRKTAGRSLAARPSQGVLPLVLA